MPREDRIFVIKFLGTAFLILIVIIVLIFLLVSHLVKGRDLEKKSQKNYAFKEIAVSSADKESVVAKMTADGLTALSDGQESESEETEPPVDNGEVELLARLIYAEAGNTSWDTQVAVGSVILNRVQSDKYPNSISEVIYQSGQYPSTSGSAFNGTPNEQSWEAARYVYQNGSQIPANVLFQSRNSQGSGVWAQLDGEYFCYE